MPKFEFSLPQQENLSSREAIDVELEDAGATYAAEHPGKRKVLQPTSDQLDEMKSEMDEDLALREIAESSESDPISLEEVEDITPFEEPKRELTNEELILLEKGEGSLQVPDRKKWLISLYKETGNEHVAENILKEFDYLVTVITLRLMRSATAIYGDEIVKSIDKRDIFQAGRLGLLEAVKRADANVESGLYSYISKYIWGHGWREIYQLLSVIKIPSHIHNELRVRRKSGAPDSWVNSIHGLMHPKGENRYIPGDDVDDRKDGLGDIWQMPPDVIGDERELVSDIVDADLLSDLVIELIMTELTERERNIIIDRYGIFGGAPMTLVELGEKYEVSRERARTIEGQALRKLRKSSALAVAALPEDEFNRRWYE